MAPMLSRSSSAISSSADPHPPPDSIAPEAMEIRDMHRVKDDFLACISHELRTPLTAILGMATLLQETTVGDLSDRQRHYTQVIHQSGQHLMAIVNDILDLTRLESGQITLNYQPTEIERACREAFESAQKLLGGQSPVNRRFDLSIEPGLSSLVADGDRLRQMLAHLLSNALKFTDEKFTDQVAGPMGLRVGRWEGWIAFTVWDRGIGIPNDKQHLLFQRFQQLEPPMTRQFEGMGLGLVLTQRLAHLHGGDVTFTSQEHQGSQFTLLLPPQPPQMMAATTRHRSGPSPANRLVLLGEGNLLALEDGVEQLTALGYRVTIARTGLEALEKARTLTPYLILLNPHLPQLSGWDVLNLLKGDPATQHLPIVMTLAPGESMRYGIADQWLPLPLPPNRLAHMLEQQAGPLQTPSVPSLERSVLLCLSPPSGQSNLLPLSELLRHHRLIEAHDLDQAELLARMWQPQVVLLNCPLPEAQTYLKHYSQRSCLAHLPLITLDEPTTRLANQQAHLAVFPCLGQEVSSEGQTAMLEAAMAIATTFGDRPLVGIVTLDALGGAPERSGHPWLKALSQYLQAAHLRVTMVPTLSDLDKQHQQETVHLLLFYWEGDEGGLARGLDWLEGLSVPPIALLLNPQNRALPSRFAGQVQVVPSERSMAGLLRQIHQHLGISSSVTPAV